MVWIFLLIAIAGLLIVGSLLVQIPLLFTGQASLSSTISLLFSLSWGPVSVYHKGDRNGKTTIRLAGRTLYQKAGEPNTSEKKDEPDDEQNEQKKKRSTDILNLLQCIYEPLLTIFHSISFDHWYCAFRCGTGEPATTGELYGYIQAIRGVLTPCPEIDLQITPDFDAIILEGETDLTFRIDRPVLLLPQVVHIARCAQHNTKQVKSI